GSWIVSGCTAERRISSRDCRRGVSRCPSRRSLSSTTRPTSGASAAFDMTLLGGSSGGPSRVVPGNEIPGDSTPHGRCTGEEHDRRGDDGEARWHRREHVAERESRPRGAGGKADGKGKPDEGARGQAMGRRRGR